MWPTTQPIRLSASSIGTAMRCPRQFFYRHWLDLPTPPSDNQQFGLLIHTLMEVFNKQTQAKIVAQSFTPAVDYTEHALTTLFNYWRQSSPNQAAPFTPEQHAQWHQLPTTNQIALTEAIHQAIKGLAASGYFTAVPLAVLAEFPVRFQLPGDDTVTFTGIIDALMAIHHPESGEVVWQVLDYKTDSPKKWRGDVAKHQTTLATVLQPLPEFDDDNPPASYSKRFPKHDRRNAQLPLYYVATKQDANLKPQLDGISSVIGDVGLQVVRPPVDSGSPGDEYASSCPQITLSGTRLNHSAEEALAQIITTIAQPFRAASSLPGQPGQACRLCDYTELCPAMMDDSEGGEA